jgi:hypothetical protein
MFKNLYYCQDYSIHQLLVKNNDQRFVLLARMQGRTAPVQAWQQKGSIGIGFDGKRRVTHKISSQQQQQQQQQEGGSTAGAAIGPVEAPRLSARKRMEQIVQAELKSKICLKLSSRIHVS